VVKLLGFGDRWPWSGCLRGYDGSERGEGDVMGQQSIRQEARRAAVDAQSKRRRERAVREKRLEGLAVRVLVAVRERDAAVARADRLAGQSLREMIEDEGLSVHEAVEWCGDEITTREATRLRHLAADEPSGGEPGTNDKNMTTADSEGWQARQLTRAHEVPPPRAD
jgi:hypothetical protein